MEGDGEVGLGSGSSLPVDTGSQAVSSVSDKNHMQ